MTRKRGWVASTTTVGAALVFACLTGCSPADPPIAPATAAQLQSAVRDVTAAAADGKMQQAAKSLDRLEAALREAMARGRLSPSRYARIQASIDLVRTDLSALLPAAPDPTPTPAPTKTVIEIRTPTVAPTPGSNGTGDQGKNKGKGNGNGNGNGKGNGNGNGKGKGK